jgi:hypothetical protein
MVFLHYSYGTWVWTRGTWTVIIVATYSLRRATTTLPDANSGLMLYFS